MVKINNFYFLFLYLLGTTTHAQKVSNVTFRQEQSNIIVSYDLETKTSCKISLFVSTDDGKTWRGPLKKVTGDAGAKIASSNHSITWNVLEEFEELWVDKIKFKVKADASNIETVIIGNQEWAVKNLDVSRYRNGDIIPEVKDPKKWANLKTGAWCYYNNDPVNGKIYGKLYNWYAVNDPRGLAPEGFHIPSSDELFSITNKDTLDSGEMIEIKKLENSFYKSKNKVGYYTKPIVFTEQDTLASGERILEVENVEPSFYKNKVEHYLKPNIGFAFREDLVCYWTSSEWEVEGRSVKEYYAFVLGLYFGYRFEGQIQKKYVGLYVRCIKD
jgi:uncharacterized protein (TIGR02145 family)